MSGAALQAAHVCEQEHLQQRLHDTAPGAGHE